MHKNYTKWLAYALIATIYMGSGLMYGHFRAYYLFLLLSIPLLAPQFFKVMRTEFENGNFGAKYLLAFPVLMLAWYGLSITWAAEKEAALIYVFYFVGGLAIAASVIAINKLGEGICKILNILLYVVGANIIMALLETTGHFRWLISRYSNFNSTFNLDPKFGIYIQSLAERKSICPVEYEYLISNPAGFSWGPNQLAFAMTLSLPFCLCLIKNRVFKVLFSLAHIYILFMAGSRAGLVGGLVASFVVFLFSLKPITMRTWLALCLCVIMVSLPFFPLEKIGVNPYRASKITSIASGVKNFKRDCVAIKEEHLNDDVSAAATIEHEDGSVTERYELVEKAWMQFKQRPFLGLGAGNSWQSVGLLFGKTHIHNFWLEILFEAGVVFFALLVTWALLVFSMLVTIFKKNQDQLVKSCAVAIVAAWIGGIPAAVAVGTVAHQPSLWLLMGISIAFIVTYLPRRVSE